MTRDELAALDERATKGVWIAAPYSNVVGAPIVASPSGRSIGKITYFNLGKGFESHDAQSEANGQLIVALVNAWRSGDLVMVPSVDEVARVIHDALYADRQSGAWMSGKCPLDSVTIDGDVDLLNAATAVLASMGAKL